MPDELVVTNPPPALPKQDSQCMKPIAVETHGPMAKAWCWSKGCEWEKKFVIPETGINLPRLQDEHDGYPRG